MSGAIRGFVHSPAAWIEASGRGQVTVREPASLVRCPAPPHVNSAKLAALATYLAPPARVCAVRGGLVLGDQGAAAAPEGLVFLSTLFRPARPAFAHPAWRVRPTGPARRIEGRAGLLTHHGGSNISHVLADGLPRLWLLLQQKPAPDVFVLSAEAPPWRDELFERAGLPLDRCVFIGPNEAIEADDLLLPEPTGFALGLAPWAPEAVRRLLDVPPRPPLGRRVWISRARAVGRRWIHEAGAAPELRRRGFDLICLETLPLREQLAVMSEAEVIAGPHGAGLAWTLASRPGGMLFELASPEHVHNDYRALAHVGGWTYGRTPAGPAPVSEREGDPRDVELAVEPAVLFESLDRALAALATGVAG